MPGEIIGINLPRPYGFVDTRYDPAKSLPDITTWQILEPDTGDSLSVIDAVNRYFFDWALTLAALFHDCAYPFSRKLIAKFYKQIEKLREDYRDMFPGMLDFNFDPKPSDLELSDSVLTTTTFDAFRDLMEKFYFCKPTPSPPSGYIADRMKNFEHDVLSAYFVYLVKEHLLKPKINEESDFKKNIESVATVATRSIMDLIEEFKRFYLDTAIHAIAFHHTKETIKWEWNPLLYLLRIADAACSFARPEIEKLRGRVVKLEGIKFGVAGTETSIHVKTGLIKIFIGLDYRNKFLSEEKDEFKEKDILNDIWETDLKDRIPNLEKLGWIQIGTELLGEFDFDRESP